MSTVIPDDVRTFLAHCPVAVLGTTKADDSLRMSTVVFVLDGDCVLVSSEFTTGKRLLAEGMGAASTAAFGRTVIALSVETIAGRAHR